MFPMPYGVVPDIELPRPEGSSFATSWALLALHEALTRDLIKEADIRDDLRGRAKHAVDFLLDGTYRDSSGLWSLYPGWRGSNRTSLGTSALVVFALHRYLDEGRASDREPFEEALLKADRALLKALPTRVPALTESDGYNKKLPYEPPPPHNARAEDAIKRESKPAALETRVDSVQSLVLPWLLIGLRDAYRNGTYMERVRALQFLEKAIKEIDEGVNAALN